MPSRQAQPLDMADRPVEVRDGTLPLCSKGGPGPTGRYAGEAALWRLEEMADLHARKIKSRGYGTHYGSECAACNRRKLETLGVESTNCVEFMLLAIEFYYQGLAELWEPQPGEWGFKGYQQNPVCQPSQLSEIGREISDRARDARSLGKKAVPSARGTVAVSGLRAMAWRTVYFAEDAHHGDVRKTHKEDSGPAGDWHVRGADTGDKIDVTVGIDHYIVGFKSSKAIADLAKLEKIPFAVGFFNWGVHTFVLGYGQLYEVHWEKGPKSAKLFDKSPFLQVAKRWDHGVVAIPPESWPFGG